MTPGDEVETCQPFYYYVRYSNETERTWHINGTLVGTSWLAPGQQRTELMAAEVGSIEEELKATTADDPSHELNVTAHFEGDPQRPPLHLIVIGDVLEVRVLGDRHPDARAECVEPNASI